MHRFLTILAIIIVVGGIAVFGVLYVLNAQSAAPASSPSPAVVSDTDTTPMHFEIATSSAAQERGLGGRSDIPHDYGMLFVFAKDGSYGFWMKDMLAPIDIIWLSDNGTISGIDDSVATSTYPSAFYPPQPVRYVLETRAGEARARGWEVGTQVALPLQD